MSPATPIANGAANSTTSSHDPRGASSSSELARPAQRPGPRTCLAPRACGTARRTAGAGARVRAGSLVSIITPSDARTRFGSAQTVKSSRPREHAPGQRVRRDQPAAERRHPGDGLRLAQPVERLGAPVLLEVRELDRGARRGSAAAAPPPPPRRARPAGRGRPQPTAASAGRHHASTPRSSAIAPAAL